MPRLLIVHHTPSPALHTLFDAVRSGAGEPSLQQLGLEVRTRPALTAGAADVLEADGYVLGTPANLGSMSGALKHFFDTIYYPCLEETVGRPWALYVHGNNDTDGAISAVQRIVAGLGWKAAAAPVAVIGAPDRAASDACWELGATVGALITESAR
jgi:NAD(P)H-dependent FMN reductase